MLYGKLRASTLTDTFAVCHVRKEINVARWRQIYQSTMKCGFPEACNEQVQIPEMTFVSSLPFCDCIGVRIKLDHELQRL